MAAMTVSHRAGPARRLPWRLVDRLVPADLVTYDHREVLYKARVLIIVPILTGLTHLACSLYMLGRADELGALAAVPWVSALAASLLLITVGLFRRQGSFVQAAHLYGFAGTLAISCLVMVTGGFGRSIFLSHWPLVVIFTFIMAGFRPACLWGLVGLGLWLAGMWVGDGAFPNLLSPAAEAVAHRVAMVVAALGFLLVLWFLGFFQDHLLGRLQVERDHALFSAAHDPLTRLANRKSFEHRLEHVLERHRHGGGGLDALLLIDLDGFKPINDTLGHRAGDLLLKAVANHIQGAIRRSDLAARLGGDEFGVLLCDFRGTEDLGPIVEKIHQAIIAPVDLDGTPVSVGASVGVALVPRDGGDTQSLLHNADQAMYRAKGSPRHYVFFAEMDGSLPGGGGVTPA